MKSVTADTAALIVGMLSVPTLPYLSTIVDAGVNCACVDGAALDGGVSPVTYFVRTNLGPASRWSRQTMLNHSIIAAERLLSPAAEYLWELLLLQEIIHSDETTLTVLRDPEKTTQSNRGGKSYMWFYGSGKFEKHQSMLYEWCRNRRQENPQERLKNYRGFLHVDEPRVAADNRRLRTAALKAVECWDKLFVLE